jgi:hypothetical protein
MKELENSKRTWKPTSEELEFINLRTKQKKMELNVGALVTTKERNRLVSLLHEYADVFAGTYIDMPSLDTYIAMHKIP